MARVFEIRKNTVALGSHLHHAYGLLLGLDKQRLPRFHVIGVCGYLCREMDPHEGFAAYMALVNLGLIKSIGRVSGNGKGNFCKFVVYRRRYTRLKVDYREQTKSSPRKSTGHHTVATKKRVSPVGAYKPVRHLKAKKKSRDIAFEPPTKLLVALLKHAGKNPRVLPKRTIVHFIFD